MKAKIESIRRKLLRLDPQEKAQRIICIDETGDNVSPNENILQITPDCKQLTRAELDELERSGDNIVLLYIRYDAI